MSQWRDHDRGRMCWFQCVLLPTAYLSVGWWGQQPQQWGSDAPLPSHLHQLLQGCPKVLPGQPRTIISLGCPWFYPGGLLPDGRPWNTFPGRCPVGRRKWRAAPLGSPQLNLPVSKDEPSHPRANSWSCPKTLDHGTQIDIPLTSIHLSLFPQSWPRSWDGQMDQTWGSKQLQDYKHCINIIIITYLLCCYSQNESTIYLFFSHTYSPVKGGFVLSRNPVSSHFQRKKQSSS